MRLLTRLTLGLLGLAASAVAEDPSTESAIELQPTSFRNFIKENDVVMAEFYAVRAHSQTLIEPHIAQEEHLLTLISSPGGECVLSLRVPCSAAIAGTLPVSASPGRPCYLLLTQPLQPALSNFCSQV